jgi:hypothetical protein
VPLWFDFVVKTCARFSSDPDHIFLVPLSRGSGRVEWYFEGQAAVCISCIRDSG